MSSSTIQYKRADIEGGLLTDESEVAYYRQVQANDVTNNLLLGDFNQNGNYVIKKEIVAELLALTKVLQHTYGKTIFCISLKELKNYGHLEFAIKIERLEGGKAVASLELLEAINKVGGYYQNINTVTVATYTDIYDMDFLKKVYQAFRIINKEDEFKGRKKLESETIDEILARKDYLAALLKISELNLSDTERKFYEARIAALSKGGEYGKAILVRMQLEANKISKLFLKPNTPQYYQKMNQLLDKVLEDMKKNLDKGLKQKLSEAEKDYIRAAQAEMLRAKNELFKAKTLPEVMSQLNQQKKAETQKGTTTLKYTPDNFKEAQKARDVINKIDDKYVEQVNKQPVAKEEEFLDVAGTMYGVKAEDEKINNTKAPENNVDSIIEETLSEEGKKDTSTKKTLSVNRKKNTLNRDDVEAESSMFGGK